MKTNKQFFALAAFACAITPTHAAVLATFVNGTDQDAAALGNKTTPTTGYTVTALSNVGFEGGTSITRSEFGTGNPTTPAGSVAGSSAGSEWLFQRSSFTATTPVSTDDYYSFTITGTGGNSFNLTNLRFNFVVAVNDNVPGTAESLAATARVYANIDGGGFNAIGSAVSASDDDSAAGFGSVQTANINLSSITGASTVELRIGVGDDANEGSRASWIQGIELNGNVIPEPSSSALLLSALSIMAFRRRR